MQPNLQVTIRPAVADDLPVIHALVRELAIYEKAEAEFTADLALYRRNFAQDVFRAHVAEADGQIIGMALYYLTFSTWKGRMLYLEDFVVRRDYRRRGVGQRLFDAYVATAKAMNCALAKWQVLDWNAPAVAFYEQNGATIEREWWNGKIVFEQAETT